jgi:prophage regulatory protein
MPINAKHCRLRRPTRQQTAALVRLWGGAVLDMLGPVEPFEANEHDDRAVCGAVCSHALKPDDVADPLVSIKTVSRMTGLAVPTLKRYVATGQLPRPLRVGIRRVAWRQSVIEAWIAARPIGGSWFTAKAKGTA